MRRAMAWAACRACGHHHQPRPTSRRHAGESICRRLLVLCGVGREIRIIGWNTIRSGRPRAAMPSLRFFACGCRRLAHTSPARPGRTSSSWHGRAARAGHAHRERLPAYDRTGQATNVTVYHQVLNRSRSKGSGLAQALLGLVVTALVPEGPVIIGVDDTTERRLRPRISPHRLARRPVRSRPRRG